MDTALKTELIDLLEKVVDEGQRTMYCSEDDEVGSHSCCDMCSYMEHDPDCYIPAAQKMLAKLKAI
jgi:hypothetical protein